MEQIQKKVNTFVKTLNKGDEFEIMFGNYLPSNKLSLVQFNNILKNMKVMKKELIKNISLDIISSSIKDNISTAYRMTINGIKNINIFVNNIINKDNNMIIDFLINNYYDKSFVEFIIKTKKRSDIYDDNTNDIRIRKSNEEVITKKSISNFVSSLKDNMSSNDTLYYRYKERLTAVIIDSNDVRLVLDSTIIKNNNNIKLLGTNNNSYEVELDLMIKNNKLSSSNIKKLLDNILFIKKILLESDNILSNEEKYDIIRNYKILVYGVNDSSKQFLYSMQPISINLQNILDDLPNKYSITDKADGEKYCLYIYNNNLYLISNNLNIKKTIYKTKNLDNTILEGEYIYLRDKQKYIFMIFDCLFFKGNDIRNTNYLEDRLDYINNVLDEMNINKYYKYSKYNKKIEIKKIQDKLKEHYTNEMINFYNVLNTSINTNETNSITFYPKFFIHPMNINMMNVYMYSYIIWNNCTKNKDILCPYKLDGIIYTGLNQKYTNDKREHKYPIYKYKPPETNSIDVYIRFKKNRNTNKDYIVYDNTVITDTKFMIVELMVGDNIGNNEIPSPFLKKENNHIAYFPIKDGYIRDIEGNIISSETVIEITYNHKSDLPHQYRWNILRTRWDKTESVNIFRKKYGNYKTVAISTWNTIKQKVTINDLYNLSLPDKYLVNKNNLMYRLGNYVIKSNKYFQKTSSLGIPFKKFTNWIKSNLIYTYCSSYDEKKIVLDIGFGRGADISKYFYAKIKELVAIDYDYDALYSSYDSATKRYNKTKHMPGFPKMNFIQADFGSLLTLEEQKKAILNYPFESSKIFNKVLLNKKFDCIVSNLAIHYMFKNDISLNNLVTNINKHLNIYGYVIFTLFDGKLVMDMLNGNNIYTSYRMNEDGKKVKYYEIIKKFNGNKLENKTGNAIDVHMSWIFEENQYQEEYLISQEFMINSMKKANLKLIETDTFHNIYMINRPYFNDVIEYESDARNKKVYKDFGLIYKNDNIEDRKWMFLYRYYIFKLI